MSDPSNAPALCALTRQARKQSFGALLRGRRYRDAKFRRQHAIGTYVVDFACVSLLLVVEVDGPSHSDTEQAAFDANRTTDLERWGWRVARIPNDNVLAGGDGLYDFLDRALQG